MNIYIIWTAAIQSYHVTFNTLNCSIKFHFFFMTQSHVWIASTFLKYLISHCFSFPTRLTFLLFLTHAKFAHAWGHLFKLAPLPGICSRKSLIFAKWFCYSEFGTHVTSLAKHFLATQSKRATLLLDRTASYFNYLHTIHH